MVRESALGKPFLGLCLGPQALLSFSEENGGIACHTGRQRCFFEEFRDGAWVVTDPVLKDPREMYGA